MTTRFGVSDGEGIISDGCQMAINLIDQPLHKDDQHKQDMPFMAADQFQTQSLNEACPKKDPENWRHLRENISKKEEPQDPDERKTR